MMEPTDHDPTYEAEGELCPDCDGTGTVTEDRADRHGEHTTVEVPCETCGRGGERTPDTWLRDPPDRDEDAEVEWEAPW